MHHQPPPNSLAQLPVKKLRTAFHANPKTGIKDAKPSPAKIGIQSFVLE